MTNTNTKFQVVYKMSYAMALIKKGYKPIYTLPNPQNDKLICWVFEKTEEFYKDFQRLLKGE